METEKEMERETEKDEEMDEEIEMEKLEKSEKSGKKRTQKRHTTKIAPANCRLCKRKVPTVEIVSLGFFCKRCSDAIVDKAHERRKLVIVNIL